MESNAAPCKIFLATRSLDSRFIRQSILYPMICLWWDNRKGKPPGSLLKPGDFGKVTWWFERFINRMRLDAMSISAPISLYTLALIDLRIKIVPARKMAQMSRRLMYEKCMLPCSSDIGASLYSSFGVGIPCYGFRYVLSKWTGQIRQRKIVVRQQEASYQFE